ncbi:MAG: ATP-binding protein [Lentisphaerae bacterium]|jgi:AAA+ ATPase superfamily predicted ATPase|nr:ATP-binding protein [Lentisphaerota bacterium]
MKAKPANPFLVSGYQGPDYFCDREKETEELASALANGRNVCLVSPRRMGKTGLILHLFNRLDATIPSVRCRFYIDIFSTQNLHDFTTMLARAVVGRLDDHSEAALRRIGSFFKSFRPTFSFDSQTGAPTLSFDIKPSETRRSLSEVFDYIRESGKRCVIAIDEFQQILEYPDKGVEADLRSHAQFLPNAGLVFSGSKKHLMEEMFSSAKRPFYQSTQKIALGEIQLEPYRTFATGLFAKANRVLEPEAFDWIYNELSGHTWYVQMALNRIFASGRKTTAVSDAQEAIDAAIACEDATYKAFCEMLPRGQLAVLKALAVERGVAEPFKGSFLAKHRLGAASSVRQALKALENKALVLKGESGKYFVYDRFFGLWLRKRV